MNTLAEFQELLSFDSDAGTFQWKVNRGGAVRAGDAAGTVNKEGYVRILVAKRSYLAHRLAWLFVHGEWPSGMLDHANLNRRDNRLSNLRIADLTLNAANTPLRRDSTSGLKGAYWNRRAGKWQSSIKVRGKSHHLGMFASKHEAHQAYVTAANKFFGPYARLA